MSHYDLYAIGNALVDSEYEVSDAQLQALGVEKRHMTLIDAERRAYLLAGVHGLHSRRTGGGSAGNTTVALAIASGTRTVTPVSMANIAVGSRFYVNQGAADQEVVNPPALRAGSR